MKVRIEEEERRFCAVINGEESRSPASKGIPKKSYWMFLDIYCDEIFWDIFGWRIPLTKKEGTF